MLRRRKKRQRARLERSKLDKPYIPKALRRLAHEEFCLACGQRYGEVLYENGKMFLHIEVFDHLFPRRFLLQLELEPNVLFNLASVCQRCHGAKLKAEERLYYSDVLGFIRELRRLNWPLRAVKRAARQFGLKEVVKLLKEDT
jgi:5-methylcytosine-specific restriction endonuclease McrA